ncbi:MAG: mucoidy inhibitor MuiA family protein [Anaerolineae bacterium]
MDVVVDTSISKVTVYPDRARVTCHGRCTVTEGAHRLIIDELPLVLDVDSVRVAGRGSARVRLMGVDVTRRHYGESPALKVRDLEQQIETLEDELRVLADDRAGWEAHARYLEGLRQATVEYARGLSRGRSTVEDQAQLAAYVREQDQETRAAMRELDVQKREVTRKLEKLRRDLEGFQAARPRSRYQARIEVEAASEGEFGVELSYVVGQAGWRPLYDLRLAQRDEDGGTEHVVEVSTFAQVTQNSGQDWKGVALTVSTARPALNQRLPELKPWYLDVYQPPRPMTRAVMERPPSPAPMAKAMAKQGTELLSEAPRPEMEAETATAEVQDGGASVNFLVPGQTDIPSDGSPHKNLIHRFALKPKLDYLAVPRHTDAVFRRATVTNDSAGPLLEGMASLFSGDEFIGRTKVEYTPAGGELELLFGAEERITIERELERRDTDKRLLRDHRQMRFGYRIELKNLLPSAVKVEVHDQIPVSRHEQINVKLGQTTPVPDVKTDLNLLEWHLTLDPGVEQAIRYEYAVEHPRGLQVMGLRD